jgi:hypothetical protein
MDPMPAAIAFLCSAMSGNQFSNPSALGAIQNCLATAALKLRADPKRKQFLDNLSLCVDRHRGAASTASRILHGKMKWRGPGFVFQGRVAAGSQQALHRSSTPGSDGAVQGVAPFISWAFISAPASSRSWMLSTCLFGSHAGPLM